MKRWLALALAAAALGACAKKVEGPTPTVTAVVNPLTPTAAPAAVCNAQGDALAGWKLNIVGEHFAPLPVDLLKSPAVRLPKVVFEGPETFELAADRVFFDDATQLTVNVPTGDTALAHAMGLGSYAVRVVNPGNEASGAMDAALLVVPPPTVTGAAATGAMVDGQPIPVGIDGTGFRASAPPTVEISGSGLPTLALGEVAVVSETRLTATVPAGAPAGTYDLTVKNPEGCSFTLPRALLIDYAVLGTLTLDPRFGWQMRNQAITIYNSPTGTQRSFSGGAPEAWIVAPLKANPSQSVQIPLRRMAYLSGTVITGVVPDCSGLSATPLTDTACPDGILPGGPYAIRVKDPSGAEGTIAAASGFTVLTDEPPVITAIEPSAIDKNGLTSASPLRITGAHFGAAAVPELLFQITGGVRACKLPVVDQTATLIRAAVPATVAAADCTDYDALGVASAAAAGMTLAPNLYVVRVQNTADPAYADFSGLIVTNPSANPANGPATGSHLAAARAEFALVEASDDLGQHYLYAIGGSDGTNALNTVEMAPISLFGNLGGSCSGSDCTFHALSRSALGGALPTGRRGLVAVARQVPGDTGYVYALGGLDPTGASMATVERAQVLRGQDAPELAQPSHAAGGTLEAGTYYYRVSAIVSDAANPNGETLASDEQPITVPASAQVNLSWKCRPTATKYRIYRTAEANGVSGQELLLAEVNAAATCTGSPMPSETWSDTGATTPAGDAPLPPGALGKWVTLSGTLLTARADAALAVVGDEVYVAGGHCTAASQGCTVAGDLKSMERATFTGADLGAFAAAGDLTVARRHFSLAVADAATAPNSFSSTNPDNTADAWVMAIGGDQNGTAILGSIEVAKVRDSTGPVAAPTFAGASYNAASVHGGWSLVIANILFQGGCTGGAGWAFRSNLACPGQGSNIAQCTAATSFKGTLNSTSISYATAGVGPRYLSGQVLFRAFVYVAGGLPSDTSTTPTATVERIIY